MSSKLKLANLEAEDLSKEILACEENVYETFIGPQPDVEALQKLACRTTFTFSRPESSGKKDENVASLKSGVVFSSIEIKYPQVRKLSSTSAVIVARVRIEAAAGGHNLSTETLTSTVWVNQDDKWLSQLHTSTTAAQG